MLLLYFSCLLIFFFFLNHEFIFLCCATLQCRYRNFPFCCYRFKAYDFVTCSLCVCAIWHAYFWYTHSTHTHCLFFLWRVHFFSYVCSSDLVNIYYNKSVLYAWLYIYIIYCTHVYLHIPILHQVWIFFNLAYELYPIVLRKHTTRWFFLYVYATIYRMWIGMCTFYSFNYL